MWKTLRSPGVIIGIVVVLLIPFAFVFQSGGLPGVPGGGAAGVLFGKPVSWSDYEEQLRWNLLWREASLPKNLGESETKRILQQDTWDRLMLLEESRRERVTVDDKELAGFIRTMPLFLDEGRFRAERYHGLIQRLGMTPQRFEHLLRESLQVDKLVTRIRESVAVTDEQARAAYDAEREQARIAFVVIGLSDYLPAAAEGVTDEQVKAYYDAHPDEFKTSEKITFEYIGQTREEAKASIPVTDEEIDDAVAEQPAQAEGAEAPAVDREKVRSEVLEKKTAKRLDALFFSLQEALDAKKPLGAAAEELQLVKKTVGPMVIGETWDRDIDPMLMLTAFGLADGETSSVIQTESGIYVMQMTKREPAVVRPLDEVKDAAKDRLARRQAQLSAKQAAAKAHEDLTQRMKDGASFEDAAKALNLAVSAPEAFTRDGDIPGVSSARSLAAAAFAAAPKSLAGPVDLPDGAALVYVKERIPADASGFESEREALRERMLAKMRDDRFVQWITDLRARADLKNYLADPEP